MLQFHFWETTAAPILEICEQDSSSFFEDDGEISLSILAKATDNSPLVGSCAAMSSIFQQLALAKKLLRSIPTNVLYFYYLFTFRKLKLAPLP